MNYYLVIASLIVLTILFRKSLFGQCGCCRRWFVYPKKRRRNTAYVNDEDNYVTLCKDCFLEQEEYWQERWDEYNASRF